MTDQHRDQRLSEGSSLRTSLDALYNVTQLERQKIVHDQIMSSIDDVCRDRKSESGEQVFTELQILIIKDIAYKIVFILDPWNEEKKGFFSRLFAQWKDAAPITKIAWIAGSLAFAVPAISGTYQGIYSAWSFVRSFHVVQDADNNGKVKQPVSGSPSSTTTH